MQKREKTGIIVFLIPINGFSPAEEIFVLATAAVFVPRGRENSNNLFRRIKYDRYKKP
jgi:hypothetical protein